MIQELGETFTDVNFGDRRLQRHVCQWRSSPEQKNHWYRIINQDDAENISIRATHPSMGREHVGPHNNLTTGPNSRWTVEVYPIKYFKSFPQYSELNLMRFIPQSTENAKRTVLFIILVESVVRAYE